MKRILIMDVALAVSATLSMRLMSVTNAYGSRGGQAERGGQIRTGGLTPMPVN